MTKEKNKKKEIETEETKEEEILDMLDDEDDDLEEKKVQKKTDDFDDDDDNVNDDDYTDLPMEYRIENIEKKLNIILVLVVITLLFGAVNTIVNLSNGESNKVDLSGANNGNSNANSGYDTSAFKEITASEIASASKSETIVLWIGHQGCGYCQSYAPKIEQAGKDYGITVRYLNLAKIVNFEVQQPYVSDTEAWDTLRNLTGKGEWEKFVADNINGTPLTVIIKNNKVVGGLSGYKEIDMIEAAFDAAGLTKK